MKDVTQAISMDTKQEGDLIYIVGLTFNELGGSHYLDNHGFLGNTVPKVYAEKSKKTMDVLSSATQQGLVAACHDCSEGGIGVAAAEMAFAGGLGISIKLDSVPLGEFINRNDYILFSESNSRFLVEIKPENSDAFEKAMTGIDFAIIGEVPGSGTFTVSGIDNRQVVWATIEELKEAWQKPLRW